MLTTPTFEQIIRKLNIAFVMFLGLSISGGMAITGYVVEAALTDNTTFNQTINAGSLSVMIADAAYSEVGSPSITMGAKDFSWSCLTAGNRPTGTLGVAAQQIYVQNPDAADSGWTANLQGSASTNVWDTGSADYDFNDAGGSGCTDGVDAGDDDGGQMTVDPSGGAIAAGQCDSCDNTSGMSKGTSDAFVEGTTNAIDLFASDGTQDIGDWTLQTVTIYNTIPAEQSAGAYTLTMQVAVVAT